MMKSLRVLQAEVGVWQGHNFPDSQSYYPLIGAVEEIGELAHAHLKFEQRIRGYDNREQYLADAEDAIGDTIIYLANYCEHMGIDLYDAVHSTWAKVRRRDWVKYPQDGETR